MSAPDGSPDAAPDTGPDTGPAEGPEPVLTARGLRVDHGRRPVVGPVDLDAAAGDLLVVQGAAGSGRTSLLLVLAGRMVPSGGTARVCGHDLPRRAGRVRRSVALAELRGVNDLDDALTVEQHVAERLVLHQPWWRPWVARRRVDEVLHRVETALGVVADGAQEHLADGARTPHALRRQEFVSDLPPLERFVLGVVLAVLGGPDVLVVDDVDALRDAEDRRRAWAGLLALDGYDDARGHHPLTVVATCQDPDAPDAVAGLAARTGRRTVRVLRLEPRRTSQHAPQHAPQHRLEDAT